ncbi:MAG: SIMPL domain-containing protein [Pseudobdellovibrionaceae bacterium]|jgi:predicted secreted protein|nr:SIMPL domain-containing protein [Pseudobdellovibrionaceae bacterium]
MKRYFLTILAVVSGVAFSSSAVLAQDRTPVLGKGQVLVTLSAQDQVEAEQDMLVAGMRIEVEDADSRIVQDKINKLMKKVVDQLKSDKDIEVSTGQYYVYIYDPNPQPKVILSLTEQKKREIWKGSQTLDFKSKDSQKILDAVAKVQEAGFVMNGLSYTLSPDKAEGYKDELLVGALKKIQDKAALIAKSLDKSSYEIVDLNVDGSYMPTPMPMMRGMAKMEMMSIGASDAMSAPVAEPGKSTVNVNVNARVILQP